MQSVCATLYCHLWPVWLCNISPHYHIKGKIFGGKKNLTTKCALLFFLHISSETFLVLRTIQWGTAINEHRSLHVVLVISLLVNGYLIFFTNWRKMITNQILPKSIQWEPSCSFRTDGQTKITKLIIAFYNFLKPPKTGHLFQNINLLTPELFFFNFSTLCI